MKLSRRSARLTTSRRTFPRRKWLRGSVDAADPSTLLLGLAESEGRIVGSNFLDERSCIAGVGPITVDPTGQNRGVGGRLMQDVLDRAARQQAAGVRLLQAGFHNRSLCLYTKLGFRTREPMSILQGKPLGQHFPGKEVRPATDADVTACNLICHQIHGFDRNCELRDAIGQNAASVVEQRGRVTGYTTGIALFGHSVAETNNDLLALIGAAPQFGGPGFLLPTRNHEVFKWCLEARAEARLPDDADDHGSLPTSPPGHTCRLFSIDAKRHAPARSVRFGDTLRACRDSLTRSAHRAQQTSSRTASTSVVYGAERTCRADLTMSVDGGKGEVGGTQSNRRD